MLRLNVNLSPFQIHLHTNPSTYTLNHFFYSAELQHADSISLMFDSDMISLDKIKDFTEASSKFVVIYAKLTEPNIDAILKLKPNMLVLCNGFDTRTHEPLPISRELSESDADIVSLISSFDVRAGIVLKPNLKVVKLLGKTSLDYIHFDTSAINSSSDIEDETEQLEELKLASIAAQKLGFGIMIGGGLSIENIHLYDKIDGAEEFVTGHNLFDMSLIDGFSSSVQRMRQLIKGI